MANILGAISAQESGGNPYAVNKDSGAYGEFQIMPENWASWAENAGIGASAPKTPENQRRVATHKSTEYYNQFGSHELVAAAWYAGPGYAQSLKDGKPLFDPDMPINAEGNVDPNGEYPSVNEYIRQTMSKMGKGGQILSGSAFKGNVYGENLVPDATVPKQATFGDKFQNAFNEHSLVGVARVLYANSGGPNQDWGLTQEDVDMANKLIPFDKTHREWALRNANSRESLLTLLGMAKEDVERRQLVDNSEYGLNTFGTILGAVLDPVNLIPVIGQEAFLAKGMANLGKVGNLLSKSKIVQYADLAAQQAALNAAVSRADEHLSGYESDPRMAALSGAFAAATFGLLKDVVKNPFRSKEATRLLAAADNVESNAIAHATGAPLPMQAKETFVHALSKHSADGIDMSSMAARLVKDGKVLMMDLASAKDLGEKLGTIVSDTTKGFHVGREGYTVVVTDHLKGLKPEDMVKQVDNLIAHEVGVHAGLKSTIGDGLYKQALDLVEKNLKNPQGPWKEVAQQVQNGSLEEALGLWIEKTGTKNGLFQTLSDSLRKKFGNEMTETDVRGFVKKALQAEVDRENGYRTLFDGSIEMNDTGIRFSANNPFNVNNMQSMLRDHADVIGTQKEIPWWMPKRLSKAMEDGFFLATPHGVLNTSETKAGAELGSRLFRDPRMRASDRVTGEEMKDYILGQLQVFKAEYNDIRQKYTLDNLAQTKLDFDIKVMKAYNAVYDTHMGNRTTKWEPEVLKAAKVLKDARDYKADVLKKDREMFGLSGPNSLAPDAKFHSNEMIRRVDQNKLMDLADQFAAFTKKDGANSLQQWLEDACFKMADRARNGARLLEKRQKAYDEEWLGKLGVPNKPPRPSSVTAAEVEDYIRKEAEDMGFGLIDQDIQNFKKKHAQRNDWETVSPAEFMMERFPMDTTMELKLPNGRKFTFDDDLRQMDMDLLIGRSDQRFAGEISFRNSFDSPEHMQKLVQQHQSQLAHGVQSKGAISKDRAKREEKILRSAVDRLRGFHGIEDGDTVLNAVAKSISTGAMAAVGGQFGLNQLGEIAGPLVYNGTRAVLDMIPFVGRHIRELTEGKATVEALKDAQHQLFGEDAQRQIFGNGIKSRLYSEIGVRGNPARALDTVQTGLNAGAKLTSWMNGNAKLSAYMIKISQSATIADSIQWANGREFSKWRNPFSKKKLEAAGIPESLVAQMKSDLLTFSDKDAAGNFIGLRASEWMDTHPQSFWRYRKLIDNQARRAITQDSLGNTMMFKDKSPIHRLLFQFKDFNFKATNGQFFRALTSGEREDALVTLLGMGTSMTVAAGIIAAKGYAMDPNKRDKYLKDNLNPTRLGYLAFMRSPVLGSPVSIANDLYEGYTGAPTVRTTVDRPTYAPPKDWGDRLGNFLTQHPGGQWVRNVSNAPTIAGKMYRNEAVTQREVRGLFNSLPLGNYLPLVYLREAMFNQAGLKSLPTK